MISFRLSNGALMKEPVIIEEKLDWLSFEAKCRLAFELPHDAVGDM
jgi:hypothetical protein